MMEMVDSYRDQFESVAIAEPLLGEVGSDATVINADKEAVAKAITAEAVKTAGFDSLDAAAADGTASSSWATAPPTPQGELQPDAGSDERSGLQERLHRHRRG